ncbi:MAG: cupin domain-containing protein [Phascolarctobacterium sp.]|nr:cupin domain-containing protein [Phascolarctobacterium sp.]
MLIQEKKIDVAMNRFGGDGEVIIEHYITESMLNSSVVMYAKVILKPGCSLGYHAHVGNTETIVVLSGSAEYNDDGKKIILKPGDIVHCLEGHSHSIGNAAAAKEDLILQALIIKTNA